MTSETKVETESIIIPMNKAGERAFEVLRSIAERHLKIAREAVLEFILRRFPIAEMVEEIAMFELKYSAVYVVYGGVKHTVTYDYITREVYFEGT